MAQVKRTRKQVQTVKGKKTARKNAEYIVETLDETLKRAEYLASSYDGLMINACRKRIGDSEFDRLYKICLKNIEYCVSDLKSIIFNPKHKMSNRDIEKTIATLSNLNKRLLRKPENYKEACFLGQLLMSTSKMQRAKDIWNSNYKEYAKRQKELADGSIDREDFKVISMNLLDDSTSEINSAIKDATAIKTSLVSSRQTFDEELQSVAMSRGFRFRDEFTKRQLISSLENSTAAPMSTSQRLEFRILIETVKAIKAEEDQFDSLFDGLNVEVLELIDTIRQELDASIITTGSNRGFVVSMEDDLLSSIDMLIPFGGSLENDEIITKLKADKNDKKDKLSKIDAIIDKASRTIKRIFEAIGIKEKDSDTESKHFTNKPKGSK